MWTQVMSLSTVMQAGHEPKPFQEVRKRHCAIRWRFLRNLFHFTNNFLKVHCILLSCLKGPKTSMLFMYIYLVYGESALYLRVHLSIFMCISEWKCQSGMYPLNVWFIMCFLKIISSFFAIEFRWTFAEHESLPCN